MAKTKKTAVPETVHDQICIKVTDYEVRLSAQISHHAYEPQYAYPLDEEAPLHEETNSVRIEGMIVDPEDRAEQKFDLTIYGDRSPIKDLDTKLDDVIKRDENGARIYRKYRGRDLPVFDPPPGMGVIEKRTFDGTWTSAIWCSPKFVSECIAVLLGPKPLYLALHECKIDRQRWLRGISVQTSDPLEE